MASRETPSARVRRLCRDEDIIRTARKQTRYTRDDRIADGEVLRRLCAYAEADDRAARRSGAPGLMAEADRTVANELGKRARRALRDGLVETLTDEHGLMDVAGRACEQAGIPERRPAVAYCLIGVYQKRDRQLAPRDGEPSRARYGLNLDAPDFAERLRELAAEVAIHVRDWAATFATIQDEWTRFELTTIRRLQHIPARLSDIVDVTADKAVDRIPARPLEQMTLAAAREDDHPRSAYLFQSPLPRWLLSLRDPVPWPEPVDPLGAHAAQPRPRAPDPAEPDAVRADVLEALVERIAALGSTRALLEAELALAEDALGAAATWRLRGADDERAFVRIRAELEHVAEGLRAEKQRLDAMLAYVLLAMRRSDKRHRIAILSLRNDALDARVIDQLAARMRAIVNGDERPPHPRPWLVDRTRAAPRRLVPANRAAELERLRDERGHRAATFAELARRLDELPARVSDLASIAAALRTTTVHAVRAARWQAADELGAIDTFVGRVFRRYAMRAQ